jgi:hypothetical protein
MLMMERIEKFAEPMEFSHSFGGRSNKTYVRICQKIYKGYKYLSATL